MDKRKIIVFSITWVLTALMFFFIMWEIDISQWWKAERFMFVMFPTVMAIFAVVIDSEIKRLGL